VPVAPLRGEVMSKQTAKFIGDLAWFSASKTRGKYSSPKEALRAHLDYILRPSECVLAWNLDRAEWLRRADTLLEKSTRSRIASKIVFALPNDLSPSEGLALLKEFLTSREIFFYKVREDGKTKRVPVKLDDSDFGVAVHDSRGISGVRNLHAHVLFSPVHKGRKLDANKKSLSRLHKEWESFLKSKGYHLRKSPIKEPHYGPSRLRYDSRARASYRHLTRAKQYWREALERERVVRMLESAVQAQPTEGLLTWDEILEETPARGERKLQGRSSSKLVRKPTVQSRPSPKSVRKLKPRPKKPLSHSSRQSGRQSSQQQQQSAKANNEAEREHLKFLRALEAEYERKLRKEEERRRREAEVLQQQYEEPDDDWDRGPGM